MLGAACLVLVLVVLVVLAVLVLVAVDKHHKGPVMHLRPYLIERIMAAYSRLLFVEAAASGVAYSRLLFVGVAASFQVVWLVVEQPYRVKLAYRTWGKLLVYRCSHLPNLVEYTGGRILGM